MRPVLVDSNVLLDIITDDPRWGSWSSEQLATLANETLWFFELCKGHYETSSKSATRYRNIDTYIDISILHGTFIPDRR